MNSIQPTTLIHRANNFLSTELDGELVLMDIEKGSYYSLANTAKRIWDLIEQPQAFDAICQALLGSYEAPLSLIESEVKTFLRDMANTSIVIIR